MSWSHSLKTKLNRRLFVPVVAAGAIASLGAYEFAKPASALAPASEPAAAPLDDNSVSALESLDHAMETLAARVTPAVVYVQVTSKRSSDDGEAMGQGDSGNNDSDPFGQFGGPFGNRRMQPQGPQFEKGLGSGVIISPDGYIITNNHVVDGATDIRVTMTDKRILPAKLIGRDKLTDLAVIKVNATNLPNVPLGDSTELRPGQTVLAFGNPLGLSFTVSRGIVSALNRPNPGSDRRAPGEFIQTDAAINPGNSGGPLVDARGEVVGINTFLISETGGFSGMGFAIPTQIVKPTVDALIKDGKVEHAYMGVGITDVTPDEAKFFDVKNATGALVNQVEPDSPGAKAGLKAGDVVTALNGKSVNDAGQLQVEIGQKRPGTKVDLTVMREGKTMQLPVTLEAMGARDKGAESASAENGKPRWGVGVADVTPEIREQVNAPSQVNGAVIERVVPGSSADDAGLQQGQIITEVNRHQVRSAADVQRELSNVPAGKDALVLVWSPNGGSTFRVLHPTQG